MSACASPPCAPSETSKGTYSEAHHREHHQDRSVDRERGSMKWRPVLDRLLDFALPEPNSGCWLWMGRCSPKGYGQISGTDQMMRPAHCVAYELFKGPIPEGTEIDHLCRVRCCVNPQHLEAVTHRENVLRIQRPSHCPSGHLYDERNTRFFRSNARPGPARSCRACATANMRKWRARRRSAKQVTLYIARMRFFL